ncbi:MAG: nitroreductase family protein [Gammaproteobacteria bacterium]|nr:nitroreductase family protein [Gammaproteobacteria bacterium]
MDAIECIKSRKSIRGFKAESVPRDLLMEIISTAKQSPSYKNTQPWEIMIVSGQRKQALSEMLLGLLAEDAPISPDFPEPKSWPQAQQDRINHLYKMRSEATGLDLTDPALIRKSKQNNFKFYHAPHAIYLYQDASLSPWSIFDIGLFAQSLMLAANASGLGSVPQAFATDYAKQVKGFLGIADSKRLIVGMSIGYPDMTLPINQLSTDRVPTEELVTWLE